MSTALEGPIRGPLSHLRNAAAIASQGAPPIPNAFRTQERCIFGSTEGHEFELRCMSSEITQEIIHTVELPSDMTLGLDEYDRGPACNNARVLADAMAGVAAVATASLAERTGQYREPQKSLGTDLRHPGARAAQLVPRPSRAVVELATYSALESYITS